jgi:hypothetical protein
MAGMATITLDEIERHHPDVLLPPDPEFAEDYAEAVRAGREAAKQRSIAFVMICRNSQPWLERTLAALEKTGDCFASWQAFAFENDSQDDTKEVLSAWSDGRQRHVSLNINKRPHLNYTIDPVRTHALAEYRAACQTFVRNGEPVDYVAVLDSDSWGGWSIDGLMTSVAHMEQGDWWGLGAYSWCEMRAGGEIIPAHYDGFAFRWFGWQHRTPLDWFHLMRPPIGAPPVPVNSAFGQLALYRADAYLRGVYTGETCEHCTLHKSIAEHPDTRGRFGFNPSMRVVSFWIPREVPSGG